MSAYVIESGFPVTMTSSSQTWTTVADRDLRFEKPPTVHRDPSGQTVFEFALNRLLRLAVAEPFVLRIHDSPKVAALALAEADPGVAWYGVRSNRKPR